MFFFINTTIITTIKTINVIITTITMNLHNYCIGYLSYCWNQTPDKIYLRNRDFFFIYTFSVEFIIVRKEKRQELEVADCIINDVRKESHGVYCFLFYLVQDSSS